VQTYETLFIGGEFVKPETGDLIDVISPHTEEVIGQVPDAGPADIDKAVAAARNAFDAGPIPVEERAAGLSRLSAALQARSEAIADLISSEMGSPKSWSIMGQVFSSTMVLDSYAAMATQYEWVDTRTGMMGGPVRVRRAPVGVVAAITPWNVPLFIAALKLGPGLLAGCTFVLKPAPETPLDSYALADAIIEAGIPEGVINIVPAGRETGEYIVKHPSIDKVSFTGSTAAGMRIGELCGAQLKRCTLELGGKSAAVVLDDADIATVAASIAGAECIMTGQVCSSLTRIVVTRDRHDEMVEALAENFAQVRVGDPFDQQTQMGPLAMSRQRDRVEGYIAKGIDEGATLAAGGGRPKDLERGWFIEPTVFGNVDNSSTIAQEEIFGPVLSVIPADDERDAVRIANDTIYGLNSSVFTNDVDRAREVAGQLRAGTVGHNAFKTDFGIAFGGFKQSGIGREGGKEGLLPFLETKTVILDGPPSGHPTPEG
jgi:acyl-CoA reductase-like NAD-dependent aldehyde dehydrogenase